MPLNLLRQPLLNHEAATRMPDTESVMSANEDEDVREYVNIVRETIQHEDTVLNHRLTWM